MLAPATPVGVEHPTMATEATTTPPTHHPTRRRITRTGNLKDDE
jgi:hypothetical protein